MKAKSCKVCREVYVPTKPMQTVCGPVCALSMAMSKRGKAEKQQAIRDRRETKARLGKLKSIAMLTKEAQIAFNTYIRARDKQAGHPCISSGRPLDWSGNQVDAGHYRSTGAASHLRYNLDNVHAQSKHDNLWLAGNAVDYRINLIKRIGMDRVEALESDNQPHKWTRESLVAIKADYAQRTRELRT